MQGYVEEVARAAAMLRAVISQHDWVGNEGFEWSGSWRKGRGAAGEEGSKDALCSAFQILHASTDDLHRPKLMAHGEDDVGSGNIACT